MNRERRYCEGVPCRAFEGGECFRAEFLTDVVATEQFEPAEWQAVVKAMKARVPFCIKPETLKKVIKELKPRFLNGQG